VWNCLKSPILESAGTASGTLFHGTGNTQASTRSGFNDLIANAAPSQQVACGESCRQKPRGSHQDRRVDEVSVESVKQWYGGNDKVQGIRFDRCVHELILGLRAFL
jgi:hypothetical protein